MTKNKDKDAEIDPRPYLLIAPYLLLILLLFVSIFEIIGQSFGYIPGISDTFSLDAIRTVLNDKSTATGIGLSLYIALGSTIPSVVIGVLLAWCIATLRSETVLGTILAKLPQQIPHGVACVLVVNLFLPSGTLARILYAMGFVDASSLFNQILYFPNSIGIILEYIWKEAPWVCFMMLPSITGISGLHSEAARTLGASNWRAFVTIVLPNVMPTVRTCTIIVFVTTFGLYETPYLLGSTYEQSLPVLAYAKYSLANFVQYRPIAMVLNLLMVIISTGLSLVYYIYGVKREKDLKGKF